MLLLKQLHSCSVIIKVYAFRVNDFFFLSGDTSDEKMESR